MRKLWMVGLIALAGCAIDRLALTQFEPIQGGFRYIAETTMIYPVDKEDGEAYRTEWLEQYLQDNNVCPSGYKITERKAVKKGGIDRYTIYYTGKCH